MNIPFTHDLNLSYNDHLGLTSAVNDLAIVSITDLAGTILYVNDNFIEVSKYSRKELIGQNHRLLKSGQQPQEIFVDLWETITSGKIWRGEIKNRAKDGTYYWVDTSIAPIFDKDGKPEKFISVRFLITDRKKNEEELESHNRHDLLQLQSIKKEKEQFENQANETQKFALAVESTNEHIVITDPEGIIIYANKAAEKTTGYSKSEIMGTKAGVLWGKQMPSEFYREMWDTIKIHKKPFKGEIINKRKNGSSYVAESIISPVLDKKGQIIFFVGVERDITKEKQVDTAKTEFVSLASHQLRTPLSAINWYTEMLLSGDAGAINNEQRKYLEEIYNGNHRMVELVNALLNVSRLEMGTFSIDPVPTNLIEISKSVLKELEPTIRNKNLIINENYETIHDIFADPKLLRIILQNLLSNSVKYTTDGGTISVSLFPAKAGTELDKVKLNENSIIIIISDTGFGIPADQHDRIFTKLFRADNVLEKDSEGTGLGLYIVKSIIDHIKGKIWFQSEKDNGTTFYIALPLKGMAKQAGSKALS